MESRGDMIPAFWVDYRLDSGNVDSCYDVCVSGLWGTEDGRRYATIEQCEDGSWQVKTPGQLFGFTFCTKEKAQEAVEGMCGFGPGDVIRPRFTWKCSSDDEADVIYIFGFPSGEVRKRPWPFSMLRKRFHWSIYDTLPKHGGYVATREEGQDAIMQFFEAEFGYLWPASNGGRRDG